MPSYAMSTVDFSDISDVEQVIEQFAYIGTVTTVVSRICSDVGFVGLLLNHSIVARNCSYPPV